MQMEKYLILENVNSSGQGFNPHHAENPHHETLTGFGWMYSHTTPIGTVDGSKFAQHTYRFPGTDWVVGVSCRPGFRATAHRLGSGRMTDLFGGQLDKYLRRKSKELRKVS